MVDSGVKTHDNLLPKHKEMDTARLTDCIIFQTFSFNLISDSRMLSMLFYLHITKEFHCTYNGLPSMVTFKHRLLLIHRLTIGVCVQYSEGIPIRLYLGKCLKIVIILEMSEGEGFKLKKLRSCDCWDIEWPSIGYVYFWIK